jgi:hypothetical protein
VLIDELLPAYDAVERHGITVRAPAPRAYAAIREADLAAPWVVRALLALRALPARLASPRAARGRTRLPAGSRARLEDFLGDGFALLAEIPGRELVIGVEGRFWTARGGLCATDAARFRRPPAPGTARAAWNFRVEPLDDARCRVTTETRIACADAASRRRFRLYWLFVRPGSGLIRRAMLRVIRRTAERAAVR